MANIVIAESSGEPNTPSSGNVTFYADTDSKLKYKKDDGTTGFVGTGVTEDDFDAKADLLVGTGDGTYDALTGPTVDCYVLQRDTSAATGLKWGYNNSNKYAYAIKTANYTADQIADYIKSTNYGQVIFLQDTKLWENNVASSCKRACKKKGIPVKMLQTRKPWSKAMLKKLLAAISQSVRTQNSLV